MQHAQDLDCILADTIQGEILADDQMADAGRNVFARRAREGMQDQQIPSPFQGVHETDSSVWIVFGNVVADKFEVDQGLRKQAVLYS